MSLSVLERQVAMGVFTNRNTYLPALTCSIEKFLPDIYFTKVIEDGPININMERLRQRFIQSGKRYWLFLDDDIQFLNSTIVHDAVNDLIANKWAAVGTYSSYNPESLTRPYEETLKLLPNPAVREVGWIPGYFLLVDSNLVGDIVPDLHLPDPCTGVDTTYSTAIRARGYRLGISPNVVYHLQKNVWLNADALVKTNAYINDKWGSFYFDYCVPTGCVLE